MKYIDFVIDKYTPDDDTVDHYYATELFFQVNNHNLRTWADVFEEPCVPPESITDFESLLKISSNCFDGAVYSCFKEMCGCTTLQDVNATGEGGVREGGGRGGVHERSQGLARMDDHSANFCKQFGNSEIALVNSDALTGRRGSCPSCL